MPSTHQDISTPRAWYCAFKGYGDLVIACQFIPRDDRSFGILHSLHLSPLLSALELTIPTKAIQVEFKEMPALFATHQNGLCAALTDGIRLRRGIALATGRHELLHFDSITAKERFLTWPRRVRGVVSGSKNIYLDFQKFFGEKKHGGLSPVKRAEDILILPDSRVPAKRIPSELVVKLALKLRSHGINVQVLRAGAEGEDPIGLDSERFISDFRVLLDCLNSAKAVISSDSLPAHLSEYCEVPVFVLNGKPNEYWLPKSTYERGSHSLFDNADAAVEWAVQHISTTRLH